MKKNKLKKWRNEPISSRVITLIISNLQESRHRSGEAIFTKKIPIRTHFKKPPQTGLIHCTAITYNAFRQSQAMPPMIMAINFV
jgi:hypothetical protein